MKKGISLIVLVITIIVMIIIAGAIIISLNSSNVMTKADQAVKDSDLANAKNAVTLAYAEALSKSNDGKAYSDADTKTVMALSDYQTALTKAGFDGTKYTMSVDANGCPSQISRIAE